MLVALGARIGVASSGRARSSVLPWPLWSIFFFVSNRIGPSGTTPSGVGGNLGAMRVHQAGCAAAPGDGKGGEGLQIAQGGDDLGGLAQAPIADKEVGSLPLHSLPPFSL